MLEKRRVQQNFIALGYRCVGCSGIVGGRGHIASMAGPVGVDEFARLCEKLIGVGTKVVALSLD